MSHHLWDELYSGKEKIALAIDIGTTHTAVSFAHLVDNEKPVLHLVTDWPGQYGLSKIPTVGAYHGKQARKWGSAAMDYAKEGYELVKWFKLHLHPPSLMPPPPTGCTGFKIPKLPDGVQINQVYADFMAYLLECTRASFEKRMLPDGAEIWRRLHNSMAIIITTPNGWNLAEQNALRSAAVEAKLVKEKAKHDDIYFVTEGEASVHWALAYNLSSAWLPEGTTFAVVDAGGSTVDSTLYTVTAIEPKLALREACASECVQAGGIFVDIAAKALFETKLGSSKFAQNGNLDDMEAEFRDKVKGAFDGTQQTMEVRVGARYENDPQRSVREGQLVLRQREVSRTFENVIERIQQSCCKLIGGHAVKYLPLVGGFGESPYLRRVLKQEFEAMQVKKAAAEGALIWFLKQSVTTRVAKITIGMECTFQYDKNDAEHRKRRARVQTAADGSKIVPYGFCALIEKGEVIDKGFSRSQPFHDLCPVSMERKCEYDLYSWEGQGTPEWITDRRGDFLPGMKLWGLLKIDISKIQDVLKKQRSSGGDFYDIHFDVVIKPKGTQLQAVLRAEYDGIVCEGPIALVPNAVTSNTGE